MAERLDVKLREAAECLDRLSRREDHGDLLGQEAAGHERKHPRRRTVEPLRVVDETEEGLLLGGLRQQVEDREPDEERIRRPSGAQPECNFQGVSLGVRQALHEVEARRAQLVERRERELHLAFDSDRARNPEVRSRLDRIVEQCGLADARLAVHREHAAVAVARRLQHAIEHVAVALPSEQLHRGCPDDHPGSLPPGHDYGFPGFDRPAEEATMQAMRPQIRKGVRMTTAIIGVGTMGSRLARRLAGGGESLVLAAKNQSRAQALADELGPLARAASVEDAIAGADAVVLAVWFDSLKDVVAEQARLLENKVIVDPSNPVGFNENGPFRTLPEGQSQGSVVAALLPASAHYVKAMGTFGAEQFVDGANREPRRAVLFYATDDDVAATTAERLIRATGYEPVKAGGVGDAGRIEFFGDLNSRVLDVDEARAAVAAGVPA